MYIEVVSPTLSAWVSCVLEVDTAVYIKVVSPTLSAWISCVLEVHMGTQNCL